MIGLITAETNRLLSRRITKFFPLALATLMIIGIIIAILLINSDDSGGVDFVNDIAATGGEGTDILGPMGFLIPIMAFVIGASYYGADEKAGMIEHLLTWEPRRWRFLLARALSGVASLFVISALLSGFLVVLLYGLSVVTDGDTSGAGDIFGEIVFAIVRSGVSGAIFFLFGFGLTVLVNNSVASIVGFLIWVFIIEVALIGGLLPRVGAWLPVGNSDSFVSGRDFEVFPGPFDDFSGIMTHHAWGTSGLLIFAWSAIFMIAGYVVFVRRDID